MKQPVHSLFARGLGLLLLALLGGLLLHPRPARAQAVFLRQFGPEEGLRPPFIYALLQDRQGYLWLGTGEGLVRYDGTRFVTFAKKDGLAEDFVVGLHEDASYRLWVGHYQGGISVRKTASGRFAPADPATTPADRRLAADGPPAVDTAAIGRYLRHYRLRLPAGVRPTCLLEDREGNAWLGTAGQGLWRHADRHLRLELLPTTTAPTTAPDAAPALATAWQAGNATTWGVLGAGFWPLPAANDVPLTAGAEAEVPSHLPPGAGPVRVLLPRPGGGFWLGTAAGVWAIDAPGRPAHAVAGLSASPDFDVTALTYTPGSGLWVGTAAAGLYLLPADSAQPLRHFTTAEGLLQNTVYSLLADRAGRVWVGTHGTGLAVFEPATNRFTHYRLNPAGLDVSCFAEDPDGRLWVGTEGQGLYCRLPGGKWEQFTAAGGLPAEYIYGLLLLPPTPGVAAPHLLLVHRQGLSLLDARAGRFAAAAAADDPLVRECLGTAALTSGSAARATAWLGTRAGLLRVDLGAARRLLGARPPSLVLTATEVDGEARPVAALEHLSADRHRLNFAFEGVSLSPGEPLAYQYRLLGLSDEWSHPSPAGEAQFPALDAGHYVLEARVRRGPAGPWSPAATAAVGIATPLWRRWWFRGLAALGLVGAVLGLMRYREGTMRRTQLVLERTVRERTAQLRQQKSHIEDINADLVVARDAAEASRRAKAQFLANMSHEIRTPMNAVIGLTNLLHATRPSTEQGEYLTAIESSSQSLLVIINDILDSSKMEAGKLTLEQVPFRLPEAVRRLGPMFKFATESKDLSFDIQVADNVPAAVLGDPVRLSQILVNLVGNAVKFTRQGGVAVSVERVASSAHLPLPSATHSLIRFAVRDTGIGIPADKLGAIFEDFSQANTSTTREFGGTGLGLSIARNLVQLHGGELHVRSEEGQGSEFFFELPYEVADPSAAQPEAPAGRLIPFEPALRVLVAEDNALNQLVARKTLEAWNVHVVIAENGRLAVEAVAGAPTPFDAVLMDVQMPEMDGYEASRQLRHLFPDPARLPIIGLTASVLPEDRALALAAGMNDTLAKPFEPAVLYARLAFFTGRGEKGKKGKGGKKGAEEKEGGKRETAAGKESAGHGISANGVLAPHFASPLPFSPPSPLAPNWHLLEELAGGNEHFLHQIVDTFLAEAPALEALLDATYPHDLPALARTAHKLKGQVAYFGVPVLHTQLDELERAAHHPDCRYCAPLVAAIRGQLAGLYPQLAARVGA